MKRLQWSVLFAIWLCGCASFEVDEPTECPVHHEPLREELVMLRTGAPRLEYLKAEKAEFPFSGAVYTGEIAPGNQAAMGRALVCPKCVRTENEWRREHFF